jgi:hypothetical protein
MGMNIPVLPLGRSMGVFGSAGRGKPRLRVQKRVAPRASADRASSGRSRDNPRRRRCALRSGTLHVVAVSQ